MLEMIGMGIVTGIGMIVTLLKAPDKWRMRILSNPIKFDVLVFIVMFALHGPGTFAGGMIASFAALTVSLVLDLGRKIYGYNDDEGNYVPGTFSFGRLKRAFA